MRSAVDWHCPEQQRPATSHGAVTVDPGGHSVARECEARVTDWFEEAHV